MTDPITWLPFEPATLQRAKAADHPVLLVLTVPWCHHCKDLLQQTFGDQQIQATLRDSFVAIQVDAERRPDVNERYGTGGWPTIAYLTPDGDLIANDTTSCRTNCSSGSIACARCGATGAPTCRRVCRRCGATRARASSRAAGSRSR